jgi:hypothetical protein
MTYRVQSLIGAQPIEEVSTTKNHQLGTRVKADDPTHGIGEFVYVKGVSSGAQYAWVTIDSDSWGVALLAANAIGPVGVMMATLDATTDYGWVQIYGKVAAGKCLTSFADNGRVYATATAGSVDDASVAGDVVHGAKGASLTVVSSGVAEFEISYPFIEDRVSIIS